GAMRDVVQNHVLQLLALVAMEPPIAFDANAVRDEKVKVLRAIRPIREEDLGERAVRGQYGPGFIEGDPVAGYHALPEVAPESKTETYVGLKLFVDNWRWEGTPFYVRHGKRLPKRATEIAIQFRSVPHHLFSEDARQGLEPNTLVVRIQPEEGISLKFGAKVPVQGIRIRSVAMDFVYGASFLVDAPDAYETLLLDALRGDATLFTRQDEVEEQWRLVDPISAAWRTGPDVPPAYPAGTWGPAEADLFIARDGRRWRQP
ncbi:MAG: glucose-6-phosphate dehydrogenase (NADP(+)), partial [Chloroflexi bacterium]|nr:glucose-6-phosphate dehydrogenase (NADP(+)) [Chloroflexota bacterium]